MSWDDKNLALPLQTCEVCGKTWFMSKPICAPCSWWAKKIEETYGKAMRA